MKQEPDIEPDIVDPQLQLLHQPFEQAHRSRIRVQWKCLTGLIAFTPIPSSSRDSSSPQPGSNQPAVDTKE